VGKTTTRQMIDAVLQPAGDGVASPRNYNNDIGVPLSLLRLCPEHDYAVIELAATARGEIDALARLAAPQIGVITKIGDAHLGKFGSQAEIATAKGELLGVLGRNGQAVLCGDDPWQRRLAAMSPVSALWYGRSGDCDVSAVDVQHRGGQLAFRVERQHFCVPVWGRHHLEPALAAIAVGLLYGRSLGETAEALAEFQPVEMRCQVFQHHGVTIINDAYNSSPLAAEAALKLLGEYPAAGRRMALLGDMGDLGVHAPHLHEELGRRTVTSVGLDALWTCGQFADHVVAGAVAAGMREDRTMSAADPLDCIAPLRHSLQHGDVLLVKGCRTMGLERVIEGLDEASYARAA
jgi:UDP-N-acetylmuramoyl-tripeptide--D-alanyl-D-alanine ligase